MGLGDVTNGIGAKFKNWARYVLTNKWLTVINFMKKKYFFNYTNILDILSGILLGIQVTDCDEVETLIWE